jgi:molybdate transport system substrate-binding protein
VRRAARAALAVLATTAAGCGDGDEPADLVVSAAASLKAPLTECSRDGEDPRIRLQLAGSDELAAQIRKGVRPDVYAAANTKLPDQLAAEGLLERPVVFATNRLVLATPRDSRIDALEDLERPGLRLVVGSEGVPIGDYTREVIGRLGAERERAILANVRSEEPDVRGIVGKLAQGAADAGFVYRTDVGAARLRAVPLPARLQPEVAYGAGVVKGTDLPDDARAFADGLRSGPCAQALRAAGFGAPPGR